MVTFLFVFLLFSTWKQQSTHDLFANLRVTVRVTNMSKNFNQSAKSSDKRSKFKSVICRMDAFRFGEKRPINENNITEAWIEIWFYK